MKKEPLDHERERDRWLGATFRQASSSPSDQCLDPETLAAWSDGALSANAAAAAETHMSNCSRCMAMVAALERSAPAAPVRHAWSSARVFRWLVPLTAAATAVALWIAVPGRPVTPAQPLVQDRQAASERADSGAPQSAVEEPVPAPVPVPKGRNLSQSPVLEPDNRARERAAASKDESRNLSRESTAADQNAAAGTETRERPAQGQEIARDDLAKSTPPPPAAEPTAPFAPPAAQETVDSVAGTAVSSARRAEAFSAAMSLEAVAPADPRLRWRVAASTSIERSTDGGRTWMKTIPLPQDRVKALTIVGIRARSGLEAIAQMSNGSEFYTSDGGKTWMQLQEKSAAPF